MDDDGDQDVIASGLQSNQVLWYENLLGVAMAKSVQCQPRFISQEGETLVINAQLYNPESNPATVWAFINGDKYAYSDSLQLYDDGQHDDSAASDVEARIYSNTPKITVQNFYSPFGNIDVEKSIKSRYGYSYKISSDISGDTTIYLSIVISSEYYHFWSDSMAVNIIVDGLIGNEKRMPTIYALDQNYPNPFNPITMINYQLPMTSNVELSIYNLLGQKVATLISEKQKAGNHQVEWNASGFASGIYYYRIKSGEFQDVKKMILIK